MEELSKSSKEQSQSGIESGDLDSTSDILQSLLSSLGKL